MQVTMSVRHDGPTTVATVRGDVDAASVRTLSRGFEELFRQGRWRLVVDLEGVTFLDSSGLGVLVAALRAARAHEGDLRLVCTSARFLRLFSITSLDDVFVVCDDVEEALRDLDGATVSHVG